jgi:hypothetical protein
MFEVGSVEITTSARAGPAPAIAAASAATRKSVRIK